MKKMYVVFITILLVTGCFTFAEDFFYGNEFKGSNITPEDKTNLGQMMKQDTISDQKNEPNTDSLLYKIRQYFRITGGTMYDNKEPATAYVKGIINMALGLVSFVALILIIFAFYLIFFGKGEENFGKAKKILTGVAIAIVIMGLARIIVTFLFSIYQTQAVQNI